MRGVFVAIRWLILSANLEIFSVVDKFFWKTGNFYLTLQSILEASPAGSRTNSSGFSAVGSALRSGRRGRAFESPNPDTKQPFAGCFFVSIPQRKRPQLSGHNKSRHHKKSGHPVGMPVIFLSARIILRGAAVRASEPRERGPGCRELPAELRGLSPGSVSGVRGWQMSSRC